MARSVPQTHRKGRLYVWLAADDLWWWELRAPNGRLLISADGGKSSKRNAIVNAQAVLRLISEHRYTVVDADGCELTAAAA